MRGESHRQLGRYLAEKYMQDVSKLQLRAFMLGCIQPDRNPSTYLKGSFRCQWLRGHNFPNACRYMERIANRLETRQHWTLLDYYTLGKLIHYTADAFTYAHNDRFPAQLADHRAYEAELQVYFLSYLKSPPAPEFLPGFSIMASIRHFHRKYQLLPGSIYTDADFAFHTCSCVLAVLCTNGSL